MFLQLQKLTLTFLSLASWIAIGLCFMGISAVVVAVLFNGVEG